MIKILLKGWLKMRVCKFVKNFFKITFFIFLTLIFNTSELRDNENNSIDHITGSDCEINISWFLFFWSIRMEKL